MFEECIPAGLRDVCISFGEGGARVGFVCSRRVQLIALSGYFLFDI